MEKIEKFIKNYDCTQYAGLPKFMKRRVDALKKIQLEHIKLQYQYNQKLQELEFEFEKLYQPLYEKRFKIISGELEPTDEECQLPANIAEGEFNGDQENSGSEAKSFLSPDEEAELEPKVKGVPGFWLGCLLSTYNFTDSIEDYDRKVLRYLKDIKLSYAHKDDFLTYKLDFLFDENPYFTNSVLSKTYYLKMKPDDKNPFSYEGFEVCKSEGCEINWNPGKNVMVRVKPVKQKNKTNGLIREKQKEVECDSFFYFFKPPKTADEEDVDMEVAAIMAVDFELGEIIRQSIIPKAPLYYTGLMLDDEDEDEDDEDDEDDDDEDDDDDDSDEDGEDDDENLDMASDNQLSSEDEADSLNNEKVKK